MFVRSDSPILTTRSWSVRNLVKPRMRAIALNATWMRIFHCFDCGELFLPGFVVSPCRPPSHLEGLAIVLYHPRN